MSDPQIPPDSQAPTPKRPWWRNPFIWAAIGGLIFVPAIRPLTRRVPAPPPVTGQVPAFALVDRQGSTFGSSNLKDHVYLASFISARCDAACDARVTALVKLRRHCERMGVKLWLVGFATDPEHDTPEGLRAVVEAHGGNLDHFILLTGHPAEEEQLLRGGFWPPIRRAMDTPPPRTPPLPGATPRALPSTEVGWSVLVDGDGGVRGAYPTDEEGLYEVFHRAQHVMSLRRSWR